MALGVTVMAAVVAPVFQEYVVPPLAVSVAEAPMQIVPSLGVPEVSVTAMDAVGNALIVTTTEPFMVAVQFEVVLVATTV